MQNKLNVVVIGIGMYSVGRETDGFGTILPALIEWKRDNDNIGKVFFVGTNVKSAQIAKDKISKIKKHTGIELNFDVFPKKGNVDNEAYKKVLSLIPRPACSVIVVPDHLHFKVALDCLNANLPVLMVKPLTPTLEEGKKLVRLAKKKNLYAMVEFHKRWDKANLMLRDTIQKNNIGNLLYCWVEYSQRKSIPTEIFKEWAEKTSILQYLGVHYIDIMRFVSNAIPVRTMAIGQKKWLTSKRLDTYDSIQCFIEWMLPDGSMFNQVILTNWVDPESSSAMSDQKIKLVGTSGRFESDQKERGIKINIDNVGIEQPNPDFCHEFGNEVGRKEWRGYGIDSVKNFLTDVINIKSGLISLDQLQIDRPTFAEALISTAVVESAHKSLERKNIWIDINLDNKYE